MRQSARLRATISPKKESSLKHLLDAMRQAHNLVTSSLLRRMGDSNFLKRCKKLRKQLDAAEKIIHQGTRKGNSQDKEELIVYALRLKESITTVLQGIRTLHEHLHGFEAELGALTDDIEHLTITRRKKRCEEQRKSP